jgi:hypothetical protein
MNLKYHHENHLRVIQGGAAKVPRQGGTRDLTYQVRNKEVTLNTTQQGSPSYNTKYYYSRHPSEPCKTQ